MKINRKRIRNPKKYVLGIKSKKSFYNEIESKEIEFSASSNTGEQVLSTFLEKISAFNANGSFNKLTALPEETVNSKTEITDWQGYTHFTDVRYKACQRKSIAVKSVENNGEKLIVAPKVSNYHSDELGTKNMINLFLELFGEC